MGFLKGATITLLAFAVATAVLASVNDDPAPSTASTTAAAASGSANGTGGAAQPTSASASGKAEVMMMNVLFSPAALTVTPGTTVTWTNHDPMGHTVSAVDPAQWGTEGSGNSPDKWLAEGASWSHTFDKPGTYAYYCFPHASKGADGTYKGMVGTVTVSADGAAPAPGGAPAFSMPDASVVPDPAAPKVLLPGPDGIVHVELETREVVAKLADGTAYSYWTFNGTVPGPMIRVREGDTVHVSLHNAADSTMAHSIDLHAVTGPGGGAKATQSKPGETTGFTFKALDPGLFVYHCATPHIPTHVANGMFGLILVEPKGGLPPVDREYFVVESEIYTTGGHGATGLQSLDIGKLQQEDPDYFVLNGAVGAITGDGALKANVGETVRIFFGVGGGVPSSFHIIGEVFDRVMMDGNGAATENRQTVLVPAAGAVIVEFKVEYPGDYALVDHTLTRAIDMGAVGILHVDGEADSTVFNGTETPGSGH